MALACLASLAPGSAFGQASSGRIQGRVSDEATGAPIAGAEVVVVGTTFGNVTDEEGFYFINGVPAGRHGVRAAHAGYRTTEVTDERILAGHTTTLGFPLAARTGEPEPLLTAGDPEPPALGDRTSTEAIVPGDLVDQLPLDDATGIVVLQPGVARTNRGRSLRGGSPNNDAVLINGVLARGFGRGTADGLAVPANALEQVGVNVGAFPAEFGEAQSGIVSFVTRSGGPELTGSFELMSDQLGPSAWRTNFNRAELTLGGPVAGPVTFFLAGTASGQDAFGTELAPNPFVIDGSDTCDIENFCEAGNGGPGLGAPATFRLPRESTTPDGTDFVDVSAPRFVEFDNGRALPNGSNQADLFHANLDWQLPRGSRIVFSVNRNRYQSIGHAGFATNFLFDGVDGALSTRNSYALSWFQTLKRTAREQVALDLLLAFSQDRDTEGVLGQRWWVDHQDPAFGFLTGNVDFAFDDGSSTVTGFDAFHPSDEFVNAYRSNAIPRDSLVLLPGRNNDIATTTQSLRGLAGNLRSNPYGLATGFPLNGTGGEGLDKSSEDRLQLRGAVDWQFGRAHRVRAGAEYFAIALDAFSRPLADGLPQPESADPRKVGVFLQDRLDLGRFVLDAGVRYDHLDTDAEYSRIPGFVFNVPDSLTAGFVRFDPGTGTYVPLFDVPCGGAPVCKSNFVAAETKSEFSPRLGLSFSVSPKSAVRLGYGRFVQTPAFFTATAPAFASPGVVTGAPGLLQNANFDLQNGNTNTTFARDVDLPSTRTLEAGYRQLIGDDLVVDVSAFHRTRSGALSTQATQFDDPSRPGAVVFLPVLTNAEDTDVNGFEISVDKDVGNLLDSRLSYSFVDSEGTGFDAFQNARHNINWTTGLTFPADYREGSVVGTILQDLGLFSILRVRSGFPFTREENQGTGRIGPPAVGGIPAGAFAEASTPWTTEFDLRLTKSFALTDALDLQAFVDWRNPFDIGNSSTVFLETGEFVNALFQEAQLAELLRDTGLDGDNAIDAFDIRAESPENSFNVFMLLRAEERFGNGDGVFTVAEQRSAFGQRYENDFGANSRFETSDQLMRLGVRLAF